MYLSMCVFVCVYMCICMCVYVYMCVCMCVYVYMYVCICVYVYMYVCVYKYMCMCVYVYLNKWFYNILRAIFYSRISRILWMSNTTNITHGSIYAYIIERNSPSYVACMQHIFPYKAIHYGKEFVKIV